MKEVPNSQESSRGAGIFRIIIVAIAPGIIFLTGWMTGSGRINISLLGKNTVQTENKALPDELDYSSVSEVYRSLKKNFDGDLNTEELESGLKDGLARATGDPYTEFLDKEQAREFNEELNGEFSGIGAELSKKDQAIIVISPISGFPAEAAGLKPQDIIAEVDGKSTFDMSLETAVSSIRGDAGTTVELKIIRNDEQKQISIVRDNISIPSVEHKIVEGNIGYMSIARFADDTSGLAKKVADEFKQKAVSSVILDLRGNPGGRLDTSVDVASLWLSKNDLVVKEKRSGQIINTYKSSSDGVLKGIPTVVLIDKGSASASEIVAGALKDHDIATLVGEDSFGKGSVQSLQPLNAGGVLKITIARWFTPNDRNIDKEGINPDKEVKLTKKGDAQLDAAKKILVKK